MPNTAEISFDDLLDNPEAPTRPETAPKEISLDEMLGEVLPVHKYVNDYLKGLSDAADKVQNPTSLKGLGETALSLLSGMLAMPAALAERTVAGRSSSVKKKSVSELAERYQYAPEEASGKELTNVAGAALKPMGDAFSVGGKGLSKITPMDSDTAEAVLQTAALVAPFAKGPKAIAEAHPQARAAFEDLAEKNPKAAQTVVDAVKGQHKATGEELQTTLDNITSMSTKEQEALGRQRAEKELADGEVSFDEAQKPEEIDYDELVERPESSGEEVASSLDAERRFSAGERLFAKHELDGELVPISSMEMLQSYTPDQLVSFPAEETTAKQSLVEDSITYSNKVKDQLLGQTSASHGKLRRAEILRLASRTPETGLGMVKTGNREWTIYENRKPLQSYTDEATAVNELKELQGPKRIKPSDLQHEVDETGEHIVKAPNGQAVAVEGADALVAKRIDVAERSRGQGQGSAMIARLYDEAESRGLPLHSDTSVSPAAARIFENLAKKGYQVEKSPNAEINPETGNWVTKSPKDPVFKITGRPKSQLQRINDGIANGAQDTSIALRTWMTETPEGEKSTRVSGKPEDIEKLSLLGAFEFTEKTAKKNTAANIAIGKLQAYIEQALRTVSPESLGPQAKKGAALLAKNLAGQMQKDSSYIHRAASRLKFWNKAGEATQLRFLRDFEKGKTFIDNDLERVSKFYREWNKRIYEQDVKMGVEYEARDNYIYHLFEDGDKVADYFAQHYGAKWGNPRFTKDRTFDFYDEAIKAGFKPRYTNPEDIMLARQHASDVATMQVQSLRDMNKAGVAWRITEKNKDKPLGLPATQWRAPNGERYWVHDSAYAVLNNAFNTTSLWSMKGIGGDMFRAAMWLKNTMVPVELALSLFHPLHVATIDNATAMVRATKATLSGKQSALSWMSDMVQAAFYKDLAKETAGQLASSFNLAEPSGGNRLLKVWQGKIADSELTAADKQALQYMIEGGFIPEMASQYKTKAIEKFTRAIQTGSALRTVWHAPWAALQLMQKPMFEVWIPGLKIASYLKDVQTALRTDPKLLGDDVARQLAFRKLAKSIDNRYGEMAYSTLFWNRWVKDIAVGNTLSLGWQLGFIREYGGGMMDVGQALTTKGDVAQKAARGQLDKPLFSTFYTTQALLYGGLLTWALSGQAPNELLDYTHPKTGEQNPDGTAARLNTMFYPREFVAVAKHIQHEGIATGLTDLVVSKSSGVVGAVAEWATGVNSFGKEIRDPDAPAYKQLEQTVMSTLIDLEPISLQAIRAGQPPGFALAGFSPAPKYITESNTMAAIRQTYIKYYAKKQTPYERAAYSDDARKLREFFAKGDGEKFSDLSEKMQEKYNLTGQDIRRLERSVGKGEEPGIAMFKQFSWQQQIKLLDKMTETEREIYLPVSNRQHIRYDYTPPEER